MPGASNAESGTDDGSPFPLVLPSEAELAALKRWKRQHWVEFALLALARGGIEAVRIEDLARRSDRTPGSFYSHLPNRDVLLSAMAEDWLRRKLAQVEWVHDHLRRTGRFTLSGILQDAAEHRAGRWTGRSGSELELAMRIWAHRDSRALRVVRQVDALRISAAREMVRAEYPEARHSTEIGLLLNWILAGRHIVFLDPAEPLLPAKGNEAAELLLEIARADAGPGRAAPGLPRKLAARRRRT
ncbi:TetR/AcrR family transcriptional regulator [Dankookia rubra]|uniref:TetR/AcrR family transcriptional regulator n=1 Tax=Dankookia rubra TaxID=1442381 RepID=A0A4R5Q7A9_9PROT|nr:TetR/AcrR family transcriptional regulator [Dankookia rubra]TDH57957.1 TetR/AcrR family transcriptional regulator [Dankookia rubra]